ncbi:polysaccharide biosynthesis C-terminal domain-containing protein [uncultured Traorella sp.]|uniref:lipopolysaccharide biosynthesis protein n=1 Tax=uncultured Traorella sp. TaxID=1929048 RepID=UPI0025E6B388|nr:polysaccharide biosynthesis C-terminal domain-containing protein [uncultured Traorella sp.]
MKDKKLLLNTTTSFINQIVTIICGFILPRCFLVTYGSEVNGLITSITQFLGFISLMDLGISAVVKASLYSPLAQKNLELISSIMISAKRFYKKLISIFLIYLIFLCILYPLRVENEFDWLYTVSLILAMSISLIAQYYFGIVNQTLIDADQKIYINSILNSLTLILNTFFSVILMMYFNANIQFVKLTTSLIYVIRPLFLMLYVKKHYDIDYNYKFSGEPIKQKWNGILQHVASVVLQNTDVFILTLFSTLTNVSIYNVYSLVVLGIKNLIVSLTSGMQSKMGNLLAKENFQELEHFFSKTEFFLHSVITFSFTATAILIVPFVKVYTSGINDANYNVPLFGFLITIAQMFYCLRLPYSQIVLAAGHFKETQASALIEMFLNIIISAVLVWNFGLNGVAIGTVISMAYRTLYYVFYISKHIIQRPIYHYAKHMCVDVTVFILSIFICQIFSMNEISYFSWIILAIKVCLVTLIVFTIVNYIVYGNVMKKLLKYKKLS